MRSRSWERFSAEIWMDRDAPSGEGACAAIRQRQCPGSGRAVLNKFSTSLQ